MRDAELLRYLVLAAQREGNRRLARELRPLQLTPAQAEALRILGDHEPLTLSGLGDMLVCESGSNPSRTVDRLVAAGLVKRVEGSADRRQIALSLTEAGRSAEAVVREIEGRFYEDLDRGLHGVDSAAVIGVLQRLVAGSPAAESLANRAAADATAAAKDAGGR